ncbi:hypothetical protein CYMTET_29229 [Cymbomonas tetramitiformis]|uniref:Uncharacterized protein n=1 Tax=Cymbomonas tetramitiformis TaxID=36881 RepID=A0AAE0FLF8_9CHLO|nr:hypothetical protein CYMTET_29229 [Cymbomonas tetramitiformis]
MTNSRITNFITVSSRRYLYRLTCHERARKLDLGEGLVPSRASSTSCFRKSILCFSITQSVGLVDTLPSKAAASEQKAEASQPSISVKRKRRRPTSEIRNLEQYTTFVEDVLQPTTAHYGGMGVARPSIWIDLEDPNYLKRFEKVYNEFVQGCNGQKKRVKSEQDKNMLWRQLSNKDKPAVPQTERKSSKAANKLQKKQKGGQAKSGLSREEQIEAYIASL